MARSSSVRFTPESIALGLFILAIGIISLLTSNQTDNPGSAVDELCGSDLSFRCELSVTLNH